MYGCKNRSMDDTEILDRVRTMRQKGSSPKQIARALGLSPSAVAPLVRRLAASGEAAVSQEKDLVGCWMNRGWDADIVIDGHPEWPRHSIRDLGGGLCTVLVAFAKGRDRVNACAYLVDQHCLGVKTVIGPRQLDRAGLAEFRQQLFSGFESGDVPVPLDLAQQMVHGGIEYAHGLGFEPAEDFAGAAAEHLGPRQGPSAITFGRNGRPHFVAGPYDDAETILGTLKRVVGEGNFDCTMTIGGF
jgi:hypothetical protein